MEVFLSWSGEKSKAVAAALREWLPEVLQHVKPWMSQLDIGAGKRWDEAVQEKLSGITFGVICVTSDNQSEPWLNFEAGALAKGVGDVAHVYPYLIDVTDPELLSGPLTRFQAKAADREGTRDLLRALNDAAGHEKLSDDKLERAFDRCRSELNAKLDNLPVAQKRVAREVRDLAEDILTEVRSISRELSIRGNTMRSIFGNQNKMLLDPTPGVNFGLNQGLLNQGLLQAAQKTEPTEDD